MAGIGGFLRKLVGGGDEDAAAEEVAGAAVEYNGFSITPTPRKQGGQWLTVGVVSKQFPEGEKQQQFIRAETHPSREDAESFAIVKGKQIIDEQGDRLFAGD
jgi:hypothetical protein